MDDYNIDSLTDSKNEWTVRLVNTLLPHLNDGIVSIFNEAICFEEYQLKFSPPFFVTSDAYTSRVVLASESLLGAGT